VAAPNEGARDRRYPGEDAGDTAHDPDADDPGDEEAERDFADDDSADE
jgi:hypothetical protein